VVGCLPDTFPQIFTVSALTSQIKALLEEHYPLVWVNGEVSNLRQPLSGHYYFTLKDEGAQLRAVLFKGDHQGLRHKPAERQKIICRGRLGVYEPRGEYQLIINYLEPLGLGALAQAFEELKNRLAGEGLFAPEHKRPLPFLPQRVAVVTSPSGAAIRDFLQVLHRRFPNLEVVIFPVKVQGWGAAEEIAAAIETLNTLPDLDVLVLARGGGSIEDLWAFNEEIVARAIFASQIPVISAVGHEIDFTIADFVADLRAPTPSAAAELMVRRQEELRGNLGQLGGRLVQQMRTILVSHRERLRLTCRRLPDLRRRLGDLRLRLDDRGEHLVRLARGRLRQEHQRLRLDHTRLSLNSPRRLADARRQLLDLHARELRQQMLRRLASYRQRCTHLEEHLQALNPQAILARGYAVVTTVPEHRIVRDAAQVEVGADVGVRLARGNLDCRVQAVSRKP